MVTPRREKNAQPDSRDELWSYVKYVLKRITVVEHMSEEQFSLLLGDI